jgi:molybdopterin-guanine dinucleotide biosynthesis protein A
MGQDKGLLLFLGQPLVARQVERLRGVGSELLVTTNRLEAYAFLDVPLFADPLPGLGALGGLYTALSAAREALVAVVGVDMPCIVPALLLAEVELLLREGADLVVPRSPTGLEPLLAVYRRAACLPAVRVALDAGERKMTSWYAAVRAREMSAEEVAAVDPGFHSFINVNTPEELRRAEMLEREMRETLYK